MHSALIRRPELGDLAALTHLEQILFGELSYSYAVFRQMLDAHASNLHIADSDGRVVGYAMAVRAEDDRTVWLWSMGVLPEFRRRGIARELLSRALAAMRQTGGQRVLLTVDPGNAIAIALYKSFNFDIASHEQDYFGPGEDRLVMEAAL